MRPLLALVLLASVPSGVAHARAPGHLLFADMLDNVVYRWDPGKGAS